MGKRYDEVMKHVEVTPEMRRRILRNIEHGAQNELLAVMVKKLEGRFGQMGTAAEQFVTFEQRGFDRLIAALREIPLDLLDDALSLCRLFGQHVAKSFRGRSDHVVLLPLALVRLHASAS